MDDIFTILITLIKYLSITLAVVIVLTYLFRLVAGRNKEEQDKIIEKKAKTTEKEKEKKEADKAEVKVITKSKSSTKNFATKVMETSNEDSGRKRSSRSRRSSSKSSSSSSGRKSSKSSRTETPPVTISEYDKLRVRSKRTEVSPRMEVVTVKKKLNNRIPA